MKVCRSAHLFLLYLPKQICMRIKASLFITSFFSLLMSAASFAQVKKAPVELIKKSDLKRDLYRLADDHFRGREAGTLDELKASVWLAEQARNAGIEPAGDDGTYFQFFNLIRQRVSNRSTVKIGDRSFILWKDVIVYEPSFATVNAPIVFVDDPETVAEETIKGKVVALQFTDKGLTDPRKKIAWR